jgi:predicted dehydrogenase
MSTAYLLPNHWAHGFEGGGRIIGEACHILDMFRFLVGAPTIDVQAMGVHASGKRVILTDNFTATIRYADGSVCTLLYTAQGSQELPKEVMEIHVGGCSLSLDDFHKLRGFGVKADLYTKRQQKGHVEELVAFYQAIFGALDRRILWQEAVEVTRTSLEIHQQVQDWNNKVADFSVLLSRPGFIRLSPRYSMKAHTYRRVRKPSYTLKVPCTVL